MEQLLSVLIGGLLPPVVNFIDKHLKIGHASSLALLALVIGGIYGAFMLYAPEIVKDNIIMFGMSSIGTAVLVYEKLLNNKK